MPKNIVQMNNKYIKDEGQRKRFLEEERKKRNRFMGLVLILVILLFILPTYNLAQSYQSLQDKTEQYKQLEKEYKETSEQKEYQQDIAKKLKDDDYATKYARAKYSFSKDGEFVYTIPDLLPQYSMENILQTVKQFLEFSDEKLEELKKKNQTLKLQKDEKERNTGV